MERLLRGCMQVGNVPDAEDCVRNWWCLRDADLEHSQVDASVVRYLEQWYGSQNAPPPSELLIEYFEKGADPLRRLEIA